MKHIKFCVVLCEDNDVIRGSKLNGYAEHVFPANFVY